MVIVIVYLALLFLYLPLYLMLLRDKWMNYIIVGKFDLL